MLKNDQKIAITALKILNKKKWSDISLSEIKKKSLVKSFDKLVKNKNDVLIMINHYFDYKLSLISINIEKSSNKDMIFEIIMMRFDILQKNRKAIKSIFSSLQNKPNQLICFLPEILDSIILMIASINISNKGIFDNLKVKGILIIYISSFLVWIKDESPSLEKTMTALDNYLNQGESILNFIKKS